jgi:RNA:NAD 2'-phosphotransferase (TPT1/KptA family)
MLNDEQMVFLIHRFAFIVHTFPSGYGVTQASESWALVAKVQFFLPGSNPLTRGLQVLLAAHLPCKQEG